MSYLGLTALVGLALFQFGPRAARHDLPTLLARVEGGAPGLYHREGQANISFFPGHGWALTMAVGDDARFAPARIVIVSRLRGQLQVEQLVGIQDTRVLGGAEAEAYLASAGIPVAEIDALASARYPARSTPAAVDSGPGR